MSGIAGIYNLDGRPADGTLLRRMTDAADHRGRDGSGYWCAGPIALGHRMFHTTPESLLEQQPLTNETGSLCLTFDGRVDNRDELIRALGSAGFHLGSNTDADIVLRAYDCWGEGCAPKIIGDFAFAIWDGRRRQLYCVRDCMYNRPFCYYTNGRVFLFASELHQLFESPEVPRQPNEGLIGEFLCGNLWTREETLWKGVQRLPSAHSLIVRADGVRKVKYWDIDPNYEIRYQRDEEYSEHFLEVFREAVRCRMRSHGPVAADLSGGLDSSSVVCMVQELVGKGVVDATGFRTFSWVFPGMDCDESHYIRDVVERWGLDSHTWFPQIKDVSFFAERAARYLDFPGYPNGSMIHAYHAMAREQGYRVILTGEGGDEWLRGGLSYYTEILKHSGLLPALLEARRNNAVAQLRGSMVSTLRTWIRPFITSELRGLIRKYRSPKLPPLINPDFARRIRLKDRMKQASFELPFRSVRISNTGRASLYGTLNSTWCPHSFEIGDREDMRVGIEARNPFMDRRMAELALALPHKQRQRGKLKKYVLRQAMSGLLPESVRNRLDKADFMHFFADTFRLLGDEFMVDLAPIKNGWVREAELHKTYRHLLDCYGEGGSRKPNGTWGLWMTYAIGLWWREAVSRANGVDHSTAMSHTPQMTAV